jgi:hypothetical protein
MTNEDKYEITYFNAVTRTPESVVYTGTKEECYQKFKEKFPQYRKQRVAIDKVSKFIN